MENWRQLKAEDQEECIAWAVAGLRARLQLGMDRYQSHIHGFQGDPLEHAIEEGLDQMVYHWVLQRKQKEEEDNMAGVALGDMVKDKVSGFQGVAVSRHIYLQGVDRIGVQPKAVETEEGEYKLPKNHSFDEPELEILQAGAVESHPFPATAIHIGDLVADKGSGFRGHVVSRHAYLQGCYRLTVQPMAVEIKGEYRLPESETFDEPELKIVKAYQSKPQPKKVRTGGPERYPDRGRRGS